MRWTADSHFQLNMFLYIRPDDIDAVHNGIDICILGAIVFVAFRQKGILMILLEPFESLNY